MKIDRATITAMSDAGISFLVNLKVPGGGHMVGLHETGVEQFIRDRDAFAASHFGASKANYLEWVATDGAPRCGAITTKGTRCKNVVNGGIQRTFIEWKELDGEYCTVHGGQNSDR